MSRSSGRSDSGDPLSTVVQESVACYNLVALINFDVRDHGISVSMQYAAHVQIEKSELASRAGLPE
jgi:hypothetical protein